MRYTYDMYKRGITVIEFILVIVMVGLLAGLVVFAVTSAHEKSRVAKVIDQIAQINTATQLYITDTLQFPQDCGIECNDSNDPYVINTANLPKWNGPYLVRGISALKTPWGGRYEVGTADITGTGEMQHYFFLDSVRQAGPIPAASLQQIDKTIDDGDLSTGRVRGNGLGYGTAVGELVILFHQ